jgi:hypothetical protein
MPKSRRVLLPVVACMCVAACSNNPLARDAAPHRPRFEGGHMLGSGAIVDSASTKTPAAATMDAAAADTTTRGGHMLGSGA